MDPTLLLDSYAAKTCPYALHLNRVAPPEARVGFGEAAEQRIAAGVRFETLVGDALATLDIDLVALSSGRDREVDPAGWAADRAVRLDRTLEAIDRGAAVIWNPRLPGDLDAHRSGEPDLLMRVGDSTPYRYLPVDVKAHFALVRECRDTTGTLADLLAAGGPEIAVHAVSASAHREDLIQLAHYWRMLEAIGRAPGGEPRGAIVGWSGGVDGPPAVGWFELGVVMEEYERSFVAALGVVRRAIEIADGADLPPIGRPWYDHEICHECGWRGVCGPEMLASRHVSLVKPGRRIRNEISLLGLATIDQLADLDPLTLRPDGTAVGASAAWRDAIARARMAQAGDPPPFSFVSEVAPGADVTPRLWRRVDDAAQWPLSRCDVELDVDMESAPSGIYLWGTYLTYRPGVDPIEGHPPGYRGFGEQFTDPGDDTTAAVFLEFLDFVEALQSATEGSGRTFGAYCYAGPSAEEPAMRRCAAAVSSLGGPDVTTRVEALLGSSSWIDLLDEMRVRVASLNGHGLKVVARATGFAWRAEDAGGEASMRWYERATSDPDRAVRSANQQKILEYNEDDVRATLHLRTWFSTHGPEALLPVP